jgi:hypothetical protein
MRTHAVDRPGAYTESCRYGVTCGYSGLPVQGDNLHRTPWSAHLHIEVQVLAEIQAGYGGPV